MKCAQHTQRDAVGSCQTCGKGLCVACVHQASEPLCPACLKKYAAQLSQQLYIGITATLMAFIIGFYLWFVLFNGYLSTAIIIGFILAGGYWGWLFLNDRLFRPKYAGYSWRKKCVVIPFYYLLKLLLACCVGLFIGSYQIFKIIEGLKETKQIKQQLHESE